MTVQNIACRHHSRSPYVIQINLFESERKGDLSPNESLPEIVR